MSAAPVTTSSQTIGTNAPPRTLGTPQIIGLILGAMTPLAVLVGTLPLGLALGGPSLALAFIATGIIVGLFCVGYSQMVRRISRPGAFYNYITRGLGRPVGVSAAMIAALAYPLGLVGTFTVNSVILQGMVVAVFGVELPWQLFVVAAVVIVAIITYLGIDLSATVVFVIVAIEVIAVAAFAIAVAAGNGLASFDPSIFSFDTLAIGAAPVAFIYAFLCFQGYEAGALYAPEAKEPARTVPRALYIALVILVVVNVVATWTIVSALGIDGIQDKIFAAGIGNVVFDLVHQFLGQGGVIFFAIATFLSVFAVQISIMNFMSRYLQTLAAEDLLPAYLTRRNRFNAPVSSIVTLSALSLIVILGYASLGLDPFTQISAVAFGIGALCATVLMTLASIAVVVYFLRQPASERSLWKTTIIPSVAAVLLIVALVIQVSGFSAITGSTEAWTGYLPWVVVVVALFGFVFGLWLKRARPLTYRDLATGDTAEEAAELRALRIAERHSVKSRS